MCHRRALAPAEHNLRHLDLDVPHRVLTVVTGVSGSGKSSLVFDTICRESQRRYFETFSTYARQFLGRYSRPAVADIDGLPPAVAVDQKTVVRNPRSTVGTLSELYDWLRLLFARLGRPPAGAGADFPAADATPVLVQQSARRVPGVSRPRRRGSARSRTC